LWRRSGLEGPETFPKPCLADERRAVELITCTLVELITCTLLELITCTLLELITCTLLELITCTPHRVPEDVPVGIRPDP